jgi:hypothetical protein
MRGLLHAPKLPKSTTNLVVELIFWITGRGDQQLQSKQRVKLALKSAVKNVQCLKP